MKKIERNHKEFDYQTIVIKKENVEEIVKDYECFGWSVLNSSQHPYYENLLEVEFFRPHFIKNKDSLQYMQVNMENEINEKGRLNRRKHLKSLCVGISLGLLASMLICSAVLSFLFMTFVNGVVFACLFVLLAIATIVLLPIFISKIIKKEKTEFEEKNKIYNDAIEEYCKKARSLTEV
ncbi:MAG: hypothetical protein E7375_02800 [Clostridiales bacterium]|nr:hypothetical protein [Clostridiales bacterium]